MAAKYWSRCYTTLLRQSAVYGDTCSWQVHLFQNAEQSHRIFWVGKDLEVHKLQPSGCYDLSAETSTYFSECNVFGLGLLRLSRFIFKVFPPSSRSAVLPNLVLLVSLLRGHSISSSRLLIKNFKQILLLQQWDLGISIAEWKPAILNSICSDLWS